MHSERIAPSFAPRSSQARRRLRAAVEGLATTGLESDIRRLWLHTLDPDGTPDERGALPYVPFVPEQRGLELWRSSRVLDIGCLGGYGFGDFTRRRLAEGRVVPRLVGVDVDARSVAIARELAPLWCAGKADFIEASAEELPFANASFDLVVARLVLPYTAVDRVIAAVARVLRPGGLWLAQLHAPRYYLASLARGPKGLRDVVGRVRPLVRFGFTTVAAKPLALGEAAMTPSQLHAWAEDAFCPVELQHTLEPGVAAERPFVLLARRR